LAAGRGGADALDGRDRALADRPHRQETGAYRHAVDMHGAGAALRYAAAELGAGETQDIAQRHSRGMSGGASIFLTSPFIFRLTMEYLVKKGNGSIVGARTGL